MGLIYKSHKVEKHQTGGPVKKRPYIDDTSTEKTMLGNVENKSEEELRADPANYDTTWFGFGPMKYISPEERLKNRRNEGMGILEFVNPIGLASNIQKATKIGKTVSNIMKAEKAGEVERAMNSADVLDNYYKLRLLVNDNRNISKIKKMDIDNVGLDKIFIKRHDRIPANIDYFVSNNPKIPAGVASYIDNTAGPGKLKRLADSKSTLFLNKNAKIPESEIFGVVSHEGSHFANLSGALIPNKTMTKLKELFKPYSSSMGITKEMYEYYTKPTEVMAYLATNMKDEMKRVGVIRSVHDKIPENIFNIIDIKNIPAALPYKRMFKDEKKMIKLINELPYGVALPGMTIKNDEDIKKAEDKLELNNKKRVLLDSIKK